jgi:hypothetical protein
MLSPHIVAAIRLLHSIPVKQNDLKARTKHADSDQSAESVSPVTFHFPKSTCGTENSVLKQNSNLSGFRMEWKIITGQSRVNTARIDPE